MAENLKQYERDETSQAIASSPVPAPTQEKSSTEAAATVAAPRAINTQVFRPTAAPQRIARSILRRPVPPAEATVQASSNSYHIRVRSSMGIACRVRVRETDKVSSVVLTVSSFTGVPPSRLQLVLRKTGAELRDGNRTLKDCNVVDGDVLHMLPRLRAGPLGGYPVFCTLAEDGNDSDTGSTSPPSLSARLRRLDETQEELDAYQSQEDTLLPSPDSTTTLNSGMEDVDLANDPECEQKMTEHEHTRKRMLALRERMQQQRDAKRRKL